MLVYENGGSKITITRNSAENSVDSILHKNEKGGTHPRRPSKSGKPHLNGSSELSTVGW